MRIVLLAAASQALFATSVIRFILPASVLQHFGSEAAAGYVFSLLASGTVLGGMLYTRFNRQTTARLVLRYWVLYGALFFAAAIALQFDSWVFLVILFVVGFVGAFVDIAIVTNIQCLSDDRQVGRNFSLYYFTAVIGDATSGLIASLVFVVRAWSGGCRVGSRQWLACFKLVSARNIVGPSGGDGAR